MNDIELLINDIIYTFLKNYDKWNILVSLIEKNEYNKILKFCLNNYAKIVLEKDKSKLNEILILKKYFNENENESIKIIIERVKIIYSRKQKRKNYTKREK